MNPDPFTHRVAALLRGTLARSPMGLLAQLSIPDRRICELADEVTGLLDDRIGEHLEAAFDETALAVGTELRWLAEMADSSRDGTVTAAALRRRAAELDPAGEAA